MYRFVFVMLLACTLVGCSSSEKPEGVDIQAGSGEEIPAPRKITVKPVTKPDTDVKKNNVEVVKNPTYANGDRAHFRFSKPGANYGNNIKIYFDGTLETVVPSGSVRKELPNGTLWKPVSDNNGNLVILGPRSKKIMECKIEY